MKTPLLTAAMLAGLATPVLAAPPVALIETVQGEVAGAELMDYVALGTGDQARSRRHAGVELSEIVPPRDHQRRRQRDDRRR